VATIRTCLSLHSVREMSQSNTRYTRSASCVLCVAKVQCASYIPPTTPFLPDTAMSMGGACSLNVVWLCVASSPPFPTETRHSYSRTFHRARLTSPSPTRIPVGTLLRPPAPPTPAGGRVGTALASFDHVQSGLPPEAVCPARPPRSQPACTMGTMDGKRPAERNERKGNSEAIQADGSTGAISGAVLRSLG